MGRVAGIAHNRRDWRAIPRGAPPFDSNRTAKSSARRAKQSRRGSRRVCFAPALRAKAPRAATTRCGSARPERYARSPRRSARGKRMLAHGPRRDVGDFLGPETTKTATFTRRRPVPVRRHPPGRSKGSPFPSDPGAHFAPTRRTSPKGASRGPALSSTLYATPPHAAVCRSTLFPHGVDRLPSPESHITHFIRAEKRKPLVILPVRPVLPHECMNGEIAGL